MKPPVPTSPDLVGDGLDPEPLLTAAEVGAWLKVPAKSVYGLPVRRVRLANRSVRWRPVDVREFIQRRLELP